MTHRIAEKPAFRPVLGRSDCPGRGKNGSWAIVLLMLLAGIFPAAAQDLPRCDQRPGYLFAPRVDGRFTCLEEVVAVTDAGEMPFTGLAFAPDGTLYAARPLSGTVFALTDRDGDGLPETPRRAIDGLNTPNDLLWHDDALYIAGNSAVYRWRDDQTSVLVDDLPGETGLWTGGLAVSPDGSRLLVGVGAACDACADPERGLIFSVNIADGGERRIIAQGLRQPAGLLFFDGALWVTDTARSARYDTPALDEINRLSADTDGSHFGFPYCTGADNTPDLFPGAFDCETAQVPFFALPTHSTPLALAVYTGDAFPRLQGQMLIVLAGSSRRADVRGYQLLTVRLPEDGGPAGARFETLLPVDGVVAPESPRRYNPAVGYFSDAARLLNQRYAGTFPHRIYDIAISPQGWLYLSVGGGRILVMRPQ